MASPRARPPVTGPLVPYSVLRTAQLPGGSLILDQNLDRIKKTLDSMTETVNSVTTAIKINVNGQVGGAGGTTFDFSSNGYEDSSGVETWVDERMCDFTAAGSPDANLFVGGWGSSASGIGVLNVRVGGTPGTPDGLLIGALLTLPGGMVQHTSRRTLPNPGGTQLLKLSVLSGGAGQSVAWQAVSVRVN